MRVSRRVAGGRAPRRRHSGFVTDDGPVIGHSIRRVPARKTHIAPTADRARVHVRSTLPLYVPLTLAYCGTKIVAETFDLGAVTCDECLRKHRQATVPA